MVVVADATAAHEAYSYDGRPTQWGRHYSAQTVHELALANLNGEFATIQTTEQLLVD